MTKGVYTEDGMPLDADNCIRIYKPIDLLEKKKKNPVGLNEPSDV